MTSLALGRERRLPARRSAGPTGHPIQAPWSRELKADAPTGLFSGSKTQVNRSPQWRRWAPVFAGAHGACSPWGVCVCVARPLGPKPHGSQ